MAKVPFHSLTVAELREQFASCPECVGQAAEDLVARVHEVDPKVKAYVRFNPKGVAVPSNGRGKALSGIPISVKDNICTQGIETACASQILQGHVPPYDATVIERLRAAGAYVFGKCNMDEFAFGSSTETSAYGPTFNPWDLKRIPGGSSGGSAAAVAADEAIAALGSDTGGSIRQPAAMCGVVGMKPTYGRVSRYGLVAFGSSLDQIGPLTKTVRDCAIVMKVIAGHDSKDSTSAPVPVPDYEKALIEDVKGVRIGLPKEYFVEGIDREVLARVREAAKLLASKGARLVDISLPHTPQAVAVYYIVAVAEASANLARFDGVQYGRRWSEDSLYDMYVETRDQGFGAEAKRRILLGTFVLSAGYYDAYYLRAQRVRTLIRRDFEKAFTQADVILTPTAPTPAFGIGEKIDNPLEMYLSDIFTIPVNLAGVPAIVLPCGFNGQRLPVGLQLIGNLFQEETLFRVAHTYEQATPWHREKPRL